MTPIIIGKPEVKEGINSYRYAWANLGIVVDVDRLDDEGVGELRFWHKNGEAQPKLLHYSKLNLLSPISCSQTAKRLSKNAAIDWDTILTYVTSLTLESMRRGTPAVKVGSLPEQTDIEYQLYPILEKGQPTTIYSPGGSAKSYIAIYIASLVQYGITGMNIAVDKWVPAQGNVLYLDWESTERDMKRRAWYVKRGIDYENKGEFLYRSCDQPLIHDLPNIQKIVSDNDIQLIIIDSQMAATENSQNATGDASRYYNALRTLGCTSLTLDHVAKQDWRLPSSQAVGPFGSVVKYNRSRSQFEIQKKQTPGEDILKLRMIHRKHNEGKLLEDIGVQLDFLHDENNKLDMVTFGWIDLKTDPDFNSQDDDIASQLAEVLADGPMTVAQLAKSLDRTAGTIRATLNKKTNKKLFYHDLKNGTWEIGDTEDVL